MNQIILVVRLVKSYGVITTKFGKNMSYITFIIFLNCISLNYTINCL